MGFLMFPRSSLGNEDLSLPASGSAARIQSSNCSVTRSHTSFQGHLILKCMIEVLYKALAPSPPLGTFLRFVAIEPPMGWAERPLLQLQHSSTSPFAQSCFLLDPSMSSFLQAIL